MGLSLTDYKMLNEKLDRIIELLEIIVNKKETVEQK
jgi:hypothetical protein